MQLIWVLVLSESVHQNLASVAQIDRLALCFFSFRITL